jgi:hypothetical protein
MVLDQVSESLWRRFCRLTEECGCSCLHSSGVYIGPCILFLFVYSHFQLVVYKNSNAMDMYAIALQCPNNGPNPDAEVKNPRP